MTQKGLTESPEKMKQRIVGRESRPASARSYPGELHPILQLQRTLGNRRVAQLIQAKRPTPEGKIIGLQRKLTVGAPDDQYEQEADRVARQVINASDAVAAHPMQRAMSPEEDEDQRLQPKPLAASITPVVQWQQMVHKEGSEDKAKPIQAKLFTEASKEPGQRQPETEEEETEPIRAKSAGAPTESFEAGAGVETLVSQSKGRGSPLPDSVRTYMEPRFGADFSGVRVHTGSDSTQLNRSVSAQAFTVGRDIYYGAGKSPTDLRLTAHELTHVVQQTGNKAATALLSRAPTEVRNVELRTPPKRPKMRPAVERTTDAGMDLAKEIDAVDQLSDDELIGRRAQVAVEAAAAANDMDEAARKATLAKRTGATDAEALNVRKLSLESAYLKLLRRLRAIEYVANLRRLPPLKQDRFRYQDTRRSLAVRRANVRLEVEERVRKTGSLNAALKGMFDGEEVEAIRKEADEFASEFKGRAWDTAYRMLVTSQDAMYGVLTSYGLPTDLAQFGARRIAEGESAEAAAQLVVDEVLKRPEEELDKTVNAQGPMKKRARLTSAVTGLKKHQQRVKDLKKVASGVHAEWTAKGPKTDSMVKVLEVELPAAQKELAAAWMEAEREHKVLAAYRGREAELDKIDLGKLDASYKETNQQMKEVLVRVLPKLYDNGRALWMLKNNRLKPLAMPPVVALTSATMFIPEGSIRAGVVRDLLDAEKNSRESWLLTVAALALTIITLLPTGGMSAILIPAGIASAGLAAYSALKIYEKYERQKLLVNTDLDLSRALSNEEPSLRGFAMSLVAVGLEGFALFRLWRKGVELRKLAIKGKSKSLTEATDEFRALMNEERQNANLTNRLINELKQGTPADEAAKAAGKPPTRAEKPPASKGPVPKTPPTPPSLTVISRYGSRAKFEEAVTKKLGTGIHPRPPGWERVIEALKANPGPNNRKIRGMIEQVMDALQNPKLYGEVLGDAWDLVKAGKAADINDALLKLARKTGVAFGVRMVTKVKRGDKFFKQVATKRAHWVDKALGNEAHGQMTHLLQDLVVNKALGGPRKSAEFRQLLGRAEGTVERYVWKGDKLVPSRFAQLPDDKTPLPNTVFVDVTNTAGDVVETEFNMQTGDYVWRFTYDLFYEGGALKTLGRLPQPERLRPLLNELADVGVK